MADSFKNEIVRIDAIAEINPEKLDKSFKYKRMKYVDISSVDKGYITGYQDLSLEDAPSRAQRLTKVNDFIISTVRPGNRSFAYIKNSQEDTVFSTGFAVIRARKCDPRYLYYVLTSDTIIDHLASIADSKSAYPSINPSDIGELEIDLPPLETQKEIAHILGTLDDKIELNRKMNKTLEEIAQTLYKHWFIDFEFPNAEGKPYKSSGGEMVDSELGLIPKGWRVGCLSNIATQNSEITNPNMCPESKYIGLEHINTETLTLNGNGIASDTISTKKVFLKGDVLFGRLRPYFRKVIIAPFDGVSSTDIWVLRPINPFMQAYLFQIVSSQPFIDYVSNASEGSRMPRAKWEVASKYKVLFPTNEVIEKYGALMDCFINEQMIDGKQSSALKSIRESILQNLITFVTEE